MHRMVGNPVTGWSVTSHIPDSPQVFFSQFGGSIALKNKARQAFWKVKKKSILYKNKMF